MLVQVGLKKHAEDWEKLVKNKDAYDFLLGEITRILNNYYELDNSFPIKGCEMSDLAIKPEFYFVICSGKEADIKSQIGKYLWSQKSAKEHGIKGGVSNINIEDMLGYDITKENDGPLYAKFLIAKGEGKDIDDIIESVNYDKLI